MSRKAFTLATGIKLPSTVKGTEQAIDEYVSISAAKQQSESISETVPPEEHLGSPEIELPKAPGSSEQIFQALISGYGWALSAERFVHKDVGGALKGSVNPEGARKVVATFDERDRYLILQFGVDDLFDIDTRDGEVNMTDGADAVAKYFNDKVTEWAVANAKDKTTLKVGESDIDSSSTPEPTPTMNPHAAILQSIVRGEWDNKPLADTKNALKAAVKGLEDAGLSSQYQDLAQQAINKLVALGSAKVGK